MLLRLAIYCFLSFDLNYDSNKCVPLPCSIMIDDVLLVADIVVVLGMLLLLLNPQPIVALILYDL